MSDSQKIRVRIAEIAVGISPDVLSTYGLGSCVAVMLYDPVARVGGMDHFLLPKKPSNKEGDNPAKFCDTGIALLIEKLLQMGAEKKRLEAKLVGGSNMFPTLTNESIGDKNVKAAVGFLKEYAIKIVGTDTGGNWGRSVDFYLSNGKVVVSSYKMGAKEI